MTPPVPPVRHSGRRALRPRRLPVRAMLLGAALVCLTACGAAGASPTTGVDDATSAGNGTVSASSSSSATVNSPAAVPSAAAESASASSPPSSPAATMPAAGSQSPTPSSPADPAASAALVLPASSPVSVSVPAIGISSPLIELGRNPDGTIEVPSLDDPDSKPGWYRNSPSPGTLGPAIILGHVDSRAFGPGVFYSLQNLNAGDLIDVARADGSVAEFSIDSVQTVPKSDFPTLQVYGNLDHAGLRLITCGGEFDPNARSYESNIIVFASLVGSRAA